MPSQASPDEAKLDPKSHTDLLMPSQAKPSQAKPSQAKLNQSKSSNLIFLMHSQALPRHTSSLYFQILNFFIGKIIHQFFFILEVYHSLLTLNTL